MSLNNIGYILVLILLILMLLYIKFVGVSLLIKPSRFLNENAINVFLKQQAIDAFLVVGVLFVDVSPLYLWS